MNTKPIDATTRRLRDLAHARSGDKGNRANIGVIANDRQAYELLSRFLTSKRVATYFRTLGIGEVRRYELPRILGFNFVIEGALAGGASGSLRLDTQGKALGTALLEMSVDEHEGGDQTNNARGS